MADREVVMDPPVCQIVVETWVAEIISDWRREKRTGPLVLHHVHGNIETVEQHLRTSRREK